MHTLTSLQADIDSLHSKCNELRQSLGHPTTLESEARALVKDGGSRPGTEQALLQLRESKASELQMLSLRCCGRSTRDCHGAVTGPSGSRFNLKLLLAVADCMSTQGKELAEQTKRHEALQRENRALRDLTGQRSAAEGGSSQPLGGSDAFPASPVPSAAAPVRPSSAMAAVRRQPPPVPSDGRPSPHEAFAELFGSSSSSVSVSASVSGNVSGSGSGSSGSGSNQPSGISRQPPPQPYAPPALALQRPPPPSTAAMRQPDAPSHRAPPALRRDASGLSLTAAAALTAEVSARASANGSRELRLLSLQRRLDESLAENAMWKRQFAKRLEERLAAAGGAAAQVPTAALAQAAPTAKSPNTAPPPVKPPPAAAPGPAPPNTAPAPKAHLQPSKGAQDGAPDGAAAAVASATAADALAASEAEAERLRTELQAALVRARAAETGRDAEKQRTAKLDAELKEAHASLEKAKASADASAKQRSAGEADAAKAAASKAQGAAAQAAAQAAAAAESRAQQLEQRAEKAASQLVALHAEHAAVAAKAKAEMSADLSATRESLATAERELSEARRAAERAEARASKAEKEAEKVVAEARRVRDGALANAQAQASDDL